MDHGKYDNDLQQNANNNYARCPLPPIGKLQSPVQNIDTNATNKEASSRFSVTSEKNNSFLVASKFGNSISNGSGSVVKTEGGAVGTHDKGNNYLKMYLATSQFKASGTSNHHQLPAVNSHESLQDGQRLQNDEEFDDLNEEPTNITASGGDGEEAGGSAETTERSGGSSGISLKEKESIYKCLHCEKSFAAMSHLKSHVRTHTGEKPHRCPKCPRAFSEQSSLKRHLRLHSGERPYVCAYCSEAFCNQTSLKNHVAKHTGEKPHKCVRCQKSFIHASHLKSHLRTHTGEKPFVCIECDKSFSELTSLRRHMRIHTGEKPYACAYCGKAFNNHSSFKNHITSHNSSKNTQDGMSTGNGVADEGEAGDNQAGNKSRKSANSLPNAAGSAAVKKGAFKCSECNKTFSTKTTLKRHSTLHSGEHPFKCTHCGKGFFRQSELQQHEQTHTEEKPNLCVHCGKKFSQHSDLKQHLRIHTGVRPYQCSHCEKTFCELSSLKNHVVTAHSAGDSEQPQELWHCTYCTDSFQKEIALQCHMNSVHTAVEITPKIEPMEEEPTPQKVQESPVLIQTFKCNHCSKIFTQAPLLCDHIANIHAKSTPAGVTSRLQANPKVSCTYIHCGKAFSHRRSLQRHVRTHTGENLYKCTECGKSFCQKSSYEYHITIHSDIKPYICITCGKVFAHQYGLNRHVRTHAAEDMANNVPSVNDNNNDDDDDDDDEEEDDDDDDEEEEQAASNDTASFSTSSTTMTATSYCHQQSTTPLPTISEMTQVTTSAQQPQHFPHASPSSTTTATIPSATATIPSATATS